MAISNYVVNLKDRVLHMQECFFFFQKKYPKMLRLCFKCSGYECVVSLHTKQCQHQQHKMNAWESSALCD